MVMCRMPDCTEQADFAILEAYLSGVTITRNELVVMPMCQKHDSAFHEWIKLTNDEYLQRNIKIDEE